MATKALDSAEKERDKQYLQDAAASVKEAEARQYEKELEDELIRSLGYEPSPK